MHENQRVTDLAIDVLARQAGARAKQTGEPFEEALEAVLETEAGRQLRELANSAYSEERAADWQVSLPWQRAEERHYSWLESYMEWLEGKEARAEYHVVLEEELAGLRG